MESARRQQTSTQRHAIEIARDIEEKMARLESAWQQVFVAQRLEKLEAAGQQQTLTQRHSIEVAHDIEEKVTKLEAAWQQVFAVQVHEIEVVRSLPGEIARRLETAMRQVDTGAFGLPAGPEGGSGQSSLQHALTAIEQIRKSLARIETQLPSIESLDNISPQQYELFRRAHVVPPPPRSAARQPSFLVVVLDNGGRPHNVIDFCGALSRQQLQPNGVVLVTGSDQNAVAFDRIRGGLASDTATAVAASPAEWRAAILAASKSATAEWLLLTTIDTTLSPAALSWFAFAAQETEAVAWYADEDHLVRDTEGMERVASPIFKTAFDPEFLEQGGNYGSTIAVRRDVLEAGLTQSSAVDIRTLLDDLLRHASAGHGIGHIPRVLTSVVVAAADEPPATDTGPMPAGSAAVPAVAAEQRICVIIPTRNNQELLRQCVDSLLATAHAKKDIEIVVVDNGSDEAETLDYLAAGAHDGLFRVRRVDEPFNWARLNNLAVAETQAELLLFANNDIAMLTRGWDNILRARLQQDDIGAIGVKLVYPDGTLQHVGGVMGINHRADHEGVGEPSTAPGPGGRWRLRRRLGTVTGAFLACRRRDFQALRGFDEIELPFWFNDTDFCLRVRRRGLQILFEPAIVARHHESKTLRPALSDDMREHYTEHARGVMRRRWGAAFYRDPGFNPHYGRWGRAFEALSEPSMETILDHLRWSARVNPWLVEEGEGGNRD